MRVLVAGKSGQVATALSRCAPALGIDAACIGRPGLDLTDRETIGQAVSDTRPDIVVNAGAYTAVDKAESEPDLARAINATGVGFLAGETAARGIPLIHLSTDYVFSGDKAGPYVETDPTGPTGVYGASKLEGERLLQDTNPAHLIIRTAWVFCRNGSNFPRTMLRLAGDRDTISVVCDQLGNPTDAEEIALAVLAAARAIIDGTRPAPWGVYNFAGPLSVSWADFARMVLETSRRHGGPVARIEEIPSSQYPTPARRPANSMLDSGRFKQVFGYRHIALETALDRAMPYWLGLSGEPTARTAG